MLEIASRRQNAAQAAKVKQWARELLPIAEEDCVLVTEAHCGEAGCPTVETVIAVLVNNGRARQFHLMKPLNEVSCDDVAMLSQMQPPLCDCDDCISKENEGASE